MELKVGQIVESRQGRDVTKFYMVAGFENGRVLLCDGDKRPLGAPKAKNPNHLNRTNTVLEPEDTDTDLKLKAALGAYAAEHGRVPGAKQKGG